MNKPRPRGLQLAAEPLASGLGLPTAWLSVAEVERAAAYQSGRPRNDFVAGRLLVRSLATTLLARVAGGSGTAASPAGLAVVQHCPRCGEGAHGRPSLLLHGEPLNVGVSFSRAGGWLLLGLSPGAGGLGVDLAPPGDAAFTEEPNAMDTYAFSAAEQALLSGLPAAERPLRRARWWTLKEAVGKAAGSGITARTGLPAVGGPGRHPLLDAPTTVAIDLPAGTSGLPAHLVGAAVVLSVEAP